MAQIPRGEENLVCPLHKQSMAEVCHRCPLWIQVKMLDPQTGENVDRWDCSLAWLPTLLISLGKEAAANVAATHKVRNVVAAAALSAALPPSDEPRLIDQKRNGS